MTTPAILLAEDEPDSVTLFEFALRKASLACELQVARNGAEALEYLEGTGRFSDRRTYPWPSLVLLDLKMPLATGFEVLDRVRQREAWRGLVVIVFTASASPADIRAAYRLGANAYVVKPSTLEELIGLVKAIGGFWLGYNRTTGEGAGSGG